MYIRGCHCGYGSWSQKKSVRSPGAGVMGSCELPDVGAKNATHVLSRAASTLDC